MEKEVKILTPTNFSICAASALNYTAFLAKKLNAGILLAHVLPAVGPQALRNIDKKTASTLEQNAAYWRIKGYRIETLLLSGSRAPQIAGAAESYDCRLIIMGLSAQRRIKDYMVGSLAERVIRLSQVPVVVVKVYPQKAKARPEPVWEREDLFEGGIGDPVLGTIDVNQLKP